MFVLRSFCVRQPGIQGTLVLIKTYVCTCACINRPSGSSVPRLSCVIICGWIFFSFFLSFLRRTVPVLRYDVFVALIIYVKASRSKNKHYLRSCQVFVAPNSPGFRTRPSLLLRSAPPRGALLDARHVVKKQ